MKKALEPLTGVILSAVTWETMENLIVAVLVALIGGFAGSLGKSLHLRLKLYWDSKKEGKGQNQRHEKV